MKRSALITALGVPVLAGLVCLSRPAAAEKPADDVQTIEKTVQFTEAEQKLSVKVGDVTIDSVRIRNWPDHEDFIKGEKDLNDKHSVYVEFTYSNKNLDNDYKCRYVVRVPGKEKDSLYAQDDRIATLSKGKIGDTNKVQIKMRTHEYKLAKTMKVSFEIWRKR
jgi:hypothetical protein